MSILYIILPLTQKCKQKLVNKINVFGSKFVQNTSTYINSFLFTFLEYIFIFIDLMTHLIHCLKTRLINYLKYR